MSEPRTTLTDRIAFAEGWLDRARQQIEDGREAHGALTLLLAEAELHRAREAGISPAAVPVNGRQRPPRPGQAWAALGLAAAIAGLVAVTLVMMRAQPVVEAHDGGPMIVRLSGGSGGILRMVTVPEPAVEPMIVERTVVRPVIVRVPVRDSVRSAPVEPAAVTPVRPAPAAPPVAVSPPPPVVAASVTPPSPPLLSEADVIELVLAAERSLRRSASQ